MIIGKITLMCHGRYNTYLTVPDPYWMSGGTNKEPMGYTDAWNRVPTDEYLLHIIYMEYLYVEFVCKCIYVYFTYILDGAGI
jgi:hypothetical protein